MYLAANSNFLYCRLMKNKVFFFSTGFGRGEDSLSFDGDYVHHYDTSLATHINDVEIC